MPLRLDCKATDNIPIEVGGILPTAVRGWSVDQICRGEVQYGNRSVELGELFKVTGSAEDLTIEFSGRLVGVHRIGAGLDEGTIRINGDAGNHLGAEMTGGQLEIHGNAGDWLGAEMHGGTIRVTGNAGDLAGAAYRGSPRGMTGGTILVDGNLGNEVAHTMRRGLIACGGDCGSFAAVNMIAGSLIVAGRCGDYPGAGMRRGTVVVGQPDTLRLLPTFQSAGVGRFGFLDVYGRWLARHGWNAIRSWHSTPFELFSGDLLQGGRGEVLVPTTQP